MIWSSCAEPVPPIFIGPFFSLTAAMYSFAVLYGVSAFTHRMNWSSARRAIGVRSFQLNGTPVWSGVVKRFESVMMIVWASPFLPFTWRKPSAPAPPDLLTTMIGRGDSLCFSAMPWIRRAIWSAPPPVPAGTTNSICLVGSHAAAGVTTAKPMMSARRSLMTHSPLRRVSYETRPVAWIIRSAETCSRYFASRAAFVASSLRNGTIAGISHLSHISSTFAWKYARSSSRKCAKRPA